MRHQSCAHALGRSVMKRRSLPLVASILVLSIAGSLPPRTSGAELPGTEPPPADLEEQALPVDRTPPRLSHIDGKHRSGATARRTGPKHASTRRSRRAIDSTSRTHRTSSCRSARASSCAPRRTVQLALRQRGAGLPAVPPHLGSGLGGPARAARRQPSRSTRRTAPSRSSATATTASTSTTTRRASPRDAAVAPP